MGKSTLKCVVAVLAAVLSGCAVVQTPNAGPMVSVAEQFVKSGSSPSSVLVTAANERDDCRGGPLPNGRDETISGHIADTIKLSQMASPAPRTGAPLVVRVDKFYMECSKIPAYVLIQGSAQHGSQPIKQIEVREPIEFVFLGVEFFPKAMSSLESAIEKFALRAVER